MSDIYREAVEAHLRGSMQQVRDSDEQVDWRNVNFNTPASAPPHGEKPMERLDHDLATANAENIRQAIALQPSIEQGIAALFQAIATAIQNAVENGDPNGLMALAKHVNEDPRSWSDAVLANTEAATLTAAPRVPQVPTHMQDAFKSHGTLQHDAEQARHEHPAHPEHPVHPDHPDEPTDENDQPEPAPAPAPEPVAQPALSRSERARQQQG